MRPSLSALALFLLTVMTAQAASPGCVAFSALRSYPAYGNPIGIAAADFNGDGIVDVAITDNPTSTVSIFVANGDGTFKPPINYSVTSPGVIVAADLNKDGRPDLIVSGLQSVSILLNDGGYFSGPTPYAAGGFIAGPVNVVDVNNDHVLDLVIATSNSLEVRIGNGDGTFGAAVVHGVPGPLFSTSTGDFNGDGNVDVVYTNSASQILIGFGTGTGAFSAPVPVTTGVMTIPADVNGDGKTDLLVMTISFGNRFLTALLGNGNGTFTSTAIQPLPSNSGVIAADVNGDGKADAVAFGNDVPPNGVMSVYLGGTGGIASPLTFNISRSPFSAAAADFDGDGHVDIAMADFNARSFTIAHGNGDGTFVTAPRYGSAGHVILADLNGDGALDVASANVSPNVVSVFRGNGDGTFASPLTFPVGSSPWSLVAADLNHDGKMDLAVANIGSGTVSILLGNGSLGFSAAASYPAGSTPASIGVADFNGDGNLDLAVAGNSGLTILIGNGNGTFQTPVTFPAGTTPGALAVGDFNGDHKADVAVANNASSDVFVFLGHGDGTFSSSNVGTAATGPNGIVAGDFNGDGIPDLATSNQNGYVSVFIGNGDGTFKPPAGLPVGAPSGIIAADFNGDGALDLAVVDSDDIDILLGDGTGAFPTFVRYSAELTSSAAAGDVDGTGTIDIVASTASNSFDFLRNISHCATIAAVIPAAGPDAGGQTVTISGSNLAGTKSVQFGGVDASVTGNTPTSIVVTTPAHATGAVTVGSRGAGGAASLANAYLFATADVGVTSTLLTPPPYAAGSNVAYTITATNAGPDAAPSVTVTDLIPTGATLVSVSPSQGTCSGTTPIVCSLGTISNGGSATISLVVRTSGTPGAQTNTASATFSGSDMNSENNSFAAAIATVDPLSIPLFSNAMLLLIALVLPVIALLRMRH